MSASGSASSSVSFNRIAILISLFAVLVVPGIHAQKGNTNPKSKKAVSKPKVLDVKKNSLGMEFVWIPPGNFTMGAPTSEMESSVTEKQRKLDQGPQRRVTIKSGFWLGRFEVTQGQWQLLKGTTPSSFTKCGADCPVENVSWNDVKDFISRLNAKSDGFVYSLPTEAEWEYAARAGTTTVFAFGDSLSSTQANFNGEFPYGNAPKGPYLKMTVKVGSYKPNAWGLYDMHGNVGEWVEDWYTDSYAGLPTDGSANLTTGKKEYKVIRGGSWVNRGNFLRSAVRFTNTPDGRYGGITGFRVVARLAN